MQIIKVSQIDLMGKDVYQASSYPNSGCFLVAGEVYNFYFVNGTSVYAVPTNMASFQEIEEQKNTNLSNDFILELIAVSQNPEIIIGLKK